MFGNSKINGLERKIKDLKETVDLLDSELHNLRKKEVFESPYIEQLLKFKMSNIAKQEIQNYFYHNQICHDSKIKSLEHKIDELKEILEELIDKTGFEIRPDILVTKERLEKKSNKKLKGGD